MQDFFKSIRKFKNKVDQFSVIAISHLTNHKNVHRVERVQDIYQQKQQCNDQIKQLLTENTQIEPCKLCSYSRSGNSFSLP